MDYPEPEYGVHLVNPEHFAADLLHHFEGPHRPARAILRRVLFQFPRVHRASYRVHTALTFLSLAETPPDLV